MDQPTKPRRDKAYEAMKIMGDISIPIEEAEKRVHALIRRMKPENQALVIGMGVRFRHLAAKQKAERERPLSLIGSGRR